MEIVNAFTDLDELMQGHGPLHLVTLEQVFQMGQFYEWAKQITEDSDSDLETITEVPEEFAWILGDKRGF